MITSAHNPKIQAARALLGRPRERREAGAFVVEGVRLVEEAAASSFETRAVFFTAELSGRGLRAVDQLRARGAQVEEVSPAVMQSLAETETTQGLLAVLSITHLPPRAPLDFAVIADGPRDPGNLGTLMRTAAAAGAGALLLAPGTTDPWAPKVVRGGMGAHFRLPLVELDWPGIRGLLREREQPLEVLVSDVAGGAAYWDADLRAPVALVIGAEAQGASAEARALAEGVVHIPMPGRSESLNAAAAAAVLLFEVVRQRSQAWK
jgi:TrmH family RNA methyltransferase